MKSKVRLVVDSLYPKRHLDKVFEYSVRRVRHSLFDICFTSGNINLMGNMNTFNLDRYRFLQKLITDYAGSLKCY